MKTNIKPNFLLATICSIFIFISCSKEDIINNTISIKNITPTTNSKIALTDTISAILTYKADVEAKTSKGFLISAMLTNSSGTNIGMVDFDTYNKYTTTKEDNITISFTLEGLVENQITFPIKLKFSLLNPETIGGSAIQLATTEKTEVIFNSK